jgi:hypothetical protein
LGAIIVAFFFVLSLSSSGSDSGDSLRSGQAKRPTIHSESGSDIPAPKVGKKETKKTDKKKPSPKSKTDFVSDKEDNGDFDRVEDFKEEETDLDMEEDTIVQEAQDKFTRAVQEQLSMNQNMLSTAIGDVMEEVRTNLGTLLGDSDLVDDEDIELLANQMEDRLNEDLQAVLTEKIATLTEEETVELEVDVDLDSEGGKEGADPENEPVDLEEEEQELVVKLRNGVDDICAEARGNLKHMIAGIEKKMLAVLLKTKTGESYSVTVDGDDKVTGYKKRSSSSTSTHSSSSKEKSSSSGHHSSSSSHHSSTKPKASSSSAHSSSSSTSSRPKSSSSSHHSSSTSTHKSSPAKTEDETEGDRKM